MTELGYASASMAQLAEGCGTSKAGLYHYFPSKEAILFESLDRYTRRLAGLAAGEGGACDGHGVVESCERLGQSRCLLSFGRLGIRVRQSS